MANETRGILFEAMINIALQEAVKLADVKGLVYWNEKLDNLNTIPDFTIGQSLNEPSHIILVTAGTAAKNFNMKFWRNLAEFQESKSQLSNTPKVIDIIFSKEIREGFFSSTRKVYDFTFVVGYHNYFSTLEAWVNKNSDNILKTKESKQAVLNRDLKVDSHLSAAITALAYDLSQSLQYQNTELAPLWTLMRQDYAKSHNPPPVKLLVI